VPRKSPQAKKRLSYLKDRRNSYGESDKASRKAIPRRKQIQSQNERRVVRQALAKASTPDLEDRLDDATAKARRLRKEGWAKEPDTPLGKMLERKLAQRTKAGMIPAKVSASKSKSAKAARKGRLQKESW
jgi:hypothetical protein